MSTRLAATNSFIVPGAILDQYTPVLGANTSSPDPSIPRWVPPASRRRLSAYRVLDALLLQADMATPDQAEANINPVRLGETSYLRDALRDVTIGGSQTLVVPGAAQENAPGELLLHQAELTNWTRRSRFHARLQQAESWAVSVGEAFYRLRWGKTAGKRDLKIQVLHPMFVFPRWDEDDELAEVALVWEEERKGRTLLYKDHYKMVGGRVEETAGWYTFDVVGSLEDLRLLEADKNSAGVPIQGLVLDVPSIPIYHLPNVPGADGLLWGESDFTWMVGLLREINHTNTDLSAAATLNGIPPLKVKGLKSRLKTNGENTELRTGPGSVLNLDANGDAAYVDNSSMLTALMGYAERLEAQLFRQSRLGRIFSGTTGNMRDIESAGAVKTLMASLYSRIAQKRTIRHQVYSTMLLDVSTMLGSERQMKWVTVPEIEFGSVLPMDNLQDLAAVVDAYAQGKGPISAETAVKMAQRAGTPVTDLARETAAVQAQLERAGTTPVPVTNQV